MKDLAPVFPFSFFPVFFRKEEFANIDNNAIILDNQN